MMSKLKIILPLLIVAAVGYKFVLAKPSTPPPKPKVAGSVYVLGKEFLVNLADGRFAKVTAALVLDHDDKSTEASGHEAASPPDGFGPMGQEAIVRSVITDVLTDAHDKDLIEHDGRAELQETILKRLHKTTDVKADEVVFTDVTVQ
jgi:flagellar basal body-associated protein FliL